MIIYRQDKETEIKKGEKKMLKETIKAIESKGYVVISKENKWLGKLNESCPVVYDILRPDYSNVYGANGIAPEALAKWTDLLDDLTEAETESENTPVLGVAKETERKAKEKEWDDIYNEGAEGYNPYR